MSGNGQIPQKIWNFPADRPERRSEEVFNRKFRSSSRDEFPRNINITEHEEETHDMMTGENESPNPVPEFLTSRTALS